MLRRYQVRGQGTDVWNGLAGPLRARRQLAARLRDYVPPYRWVIRPEGKDPVPQTSRGARKTARLMLRDAKARDVRTTYTLRSTSAPILRLLIGDEWEPYVPPMAALTSGTRATVRFGREMSLVFPQWKSLGLYVAKQVAGSSYWSEHAWACAQDSGVLDQDGDGFETGERRELYLFKFHRYVAANFRRLGVVDHIYNETRWRAPYYKPENYGGSDPHSTHLHTAFADHDGKKPPWV